MKLSIESMPTTIHETTVSLDRLSRDEAPSTAHPDVAEVHRYMNEEIPDEPEQLVNSKMEQNNSGEVFEILSRLGYFLPSHQNELINLYNFLNDQIVFEKLPKVKRSSWEEITEKYDKRPVFFMQLQRLRHLGLDITNISTALQLWNAVQEYAKREKSVHTQQPYNVEAFLKRHASPTDSAGD